MENHAILLVGSESHLGNVLFQLSWTGKVSHGLEVMHKCVLGHPKRRGESLLSFALLQGVVNQPRDLQHAVRGGIGSGISGERQKSRAKSDGNENEADKEPQPFTTSSRSLLHSGQCVPEGQYGAYVII